MWLGSMKNSQDSPCNIRWTKQVKILGIIFQNDIPASNIQENWTKRLNKIDQIIARWSKRNLSITGKLCIIKTFLISQFVYPLQALIAPTQILHKLNTILFRFLWKKKYSNTKAFEKVKRSVICNTMDEGGINMLNIIDMQSSFLLNWISQLQEETLHKWKCIPLNRLNKLGIKLVCLKATVQSSKLKGLNYIHSSFWKEALIKWIDYKRLFINEETIFNLQPLWNNKKISYRNNCLFFKKWADAGLNNVVEVWADGDLISIENVREKTRNYATLLFEHNALRTALNAYSLRREDNINANNQTQQTLPHKMSPKIFRSMITKDKACTPCSTHFWLNRYNYTIKKQHWTAAHNSTKEERLRLLQWKILHNIYPTNILLQKMKIRDNNQCSLCGEVDYIEHFFWRCKKLYNFWKNVNHHIFLKTGIHITLNETDVLFGYKVHDQKVINIKIINHILLIAKMTISKYRYGDKINPTCIFNQELCVRKLE